MASSHTTIFYRRIEGIQLGLRLVAHLGEEGLVACDVEVCAARDLVDGNALSRFDVAQDACIWLGRRSGGNVSVANGGKTNKPRNYNVVSLFLVGRSKKKFRYRKGGRQRRLAQVFKKHEDEVIDC